MKEIINELIEKRNYEISKSEMTPITSYQGSDEEWKRQCMIKAHNYLIAINILKANINQ
jgi:hypothetical protein